MKKRRRAIQPLQNRIYIGHPKSSDHRKNFLDRKGNKSISLQPMFEVVPLMLDAKFHPFNPLLECLSVLLNRYHIELLGYCFRQTCCIRVGAKFIFQIAEQPKVWRSKVRWVRRMSHKFDFFFSKIIKHDILHGWPRIVVVQLDTVRARWRSFLWQVLEERF